jgi:hypothetical protein
MNNLSCIIIISFRSKAVKDYNSENKIITTDQIMLQNLRELSLSFKSTSYLFIHIPDIWKIENLQGLEKLERL